MKKKISIFTIIILSFLCMPTISKAADVIGYATETNLLFASSPNQTKPNNSCLYKVNGVYSSVYAAPKKAHCFDAGDQVTILNYDSIIASTVSNCKKGFYKASSSVFGDGITYTGYVCADQISVAGENSPYAEEFKNANIPQTYWDKLTILKKAHPNWKFTGYNTNLDFNTVVNNESIVGMNYIQSSNPIYLSLDSGSYNASNNSYKMMETGGWYAANSKTVAYYLDPRNFFDEKSIFMFENLGYNPNYQTKSVVDTIVSGTDLASYSTYFMNAATFSGNNVSPIMLAALARQEVVLSNGKLSNSANGTRTYYNFYNYGALSSCSNPIECAISFASKNDPSTGRAWDTAEKSILYGAKLISSSYINEKQNTLYFKKFNVTSNKYGNYSHQYMTNIQAPLNEAKSTYSSYSKISGLLNSTIEFLIPVYNNMPTTAETLPTSVDTAQVNQLKQQVNTASTSTVITNVGYAIKGEYMMNMKINDTASGLISKIKSSNSSAVVTIVSDGKQLTGNEKLGTNDIVKVKVNNVESSFRVIVYGDANGDGKVSAVDYVRIKNYIMGSSGLSGAYKEAADANKDGKISAVDYVNIKNYIMGKSSTLK